MEVISSLSLFADAECEGSYNYHRTDTDSLRGLKFPYLVR